MRALDIQPLIEHLPAATRTLAAEVSLKLSPDDGMYNPDDAGDYLACGASALNVILSTLQVSGLPAPASILDFGAGAGRVTRWLRAAFPHAALSACDLRPQDMAFCRATFDAETWLSGIDVAALKAPRRYDLIWVGSVLTHLSPEVSGRLIDMLLGWTEPDGVLVMSTIGRTARTRRDEDGRGFIHDGGWAQIVRQYDTAGFGYADYETQPGYGLSLTRLAWMSGLVESLPGARLVLLAEAAWDGLHDIVAIQNTDPSARLGGAQGGDAERFAADHQEQPAPPRSLVQRSLSALKVARMRLQG